MAVSETVLVVVSFLMLGVIMAALFRKIPVPYTVMLVVLGALLQWPRDNIQLFEPLHRFTLTPEIILFVFLPALVFEAGLGIPARQLRKDIAPILVLAIPALFISSFLVGYGVSSIAGLPFIIALLFGALVSATDPVAVIGLFKELGAPRRLTVLVEGESLFNDATAIVLFNMVLGIALLGEFQLSESLPAIGEFLLVFLGGALTGVVLGLIVSAVTNNLRIAGAAILIVTLSLAYLAFIIAEHSFHVSGVMAVTFAALVSSLLIVPRLHEADLHALHSTWEFLAGICNTLLFLLVGLSISLNNIPTILGLLLLTVILVQLARASVVYSLVPLAVRLFRLPLVTRGEQHIMWWGGLKGGLAIAMVLSIPESLAQRQLLIDLTAGVVMFTLLVNAPSIRVLIRRFGIDKLTDFQRNELQLGIYRVSNSIDNSLDELVSSELISDRQQKVIGNALKRPLGVESSDETNSSESYSWEQRVIAWELGELDRLFRQAIIDHTAYLDIHNDKTNMQDFIARNPGVLDSLAQGKRARTLMKFDRLLVSKLREKDWAAALLSRYLGWRLNQYLGNTVINLHLYRTVEARINDTDKIPQATKQSLLKFYQARVQRFQQRLNDVRKEFPQIFDQFETNFAIRASLASAQVAANRARELGELSDKTHHLLVGRLNDLMDRESRRDHGSGDQTRENLRGVSLFKNLPAPALENILNHTHQVSYLAGDIIIGEGDEGNALYIIVEGEAIAKEIDSEPPVILGSLSKGDFFGEMALLGQNVRTANVEASTSCVLLRISHRAILKVAAEFSELHDALEKVRAERAGVNLQQ